VGVGVVAVAERANLVVEPSHRFHGAGVVVGNVLRQLDGPLEQSLVRNDFGHQTPRESGTGVDELGGVTHASRATFPDEARQSDRETPARNHPDLGVGVGETRAIGGDEEVAGECDLESAGHGGSVDRADHRHPRAGKSAPVARMFVRALFATAADIAQIEAGAERRIAAREHDGPHLGIGIDPRDLGGEGGREFGIECIASLGSVEGDDGDRAPPFDEHHRIGNLGIGHDLTECQTDAPSSRAIGGHVKFWCATAFMKTKQLVHIAQLLDEAGYHGLMVSDHLVYPKNMQSKYPYSPHPDGRPIWEPETAWPDPWVLIGAMTSVTKQLNFTTNIYVAGHRPLLQLAKEIATASVLSDGRVALGAGAGWMKEEFDLQGQDFSNRGKRLTEMISALRAMWSGGWVEFHGEYYDIPPVTMEPAPPKPVPIYVGGHTDAALRRAAKVGDGWIGNAYPWEEAEIHVNKLKGYLREYGRENDDFEIICGLYAMPTADLYKRAEDELGLTGTLCMPWALGNPSAGDHAGLSEMSAAYRPYIDDFATNVVAKCQ